MATRPEDAPIDLLKAIAHPLRYAILACVSEGERNVGDIETITGIGQPTLSQQLSVLRQAGLVTSRREAKLVFYDTEPAALDRICTAFQRLCPASLLQRKGLIPASGAASGQHEAVTDVKPAAKSTMRRGGAAVFARLD